MMHERERRRANGLDDQREAAGQVIARTTIEPHSRAVLPGDNPKAVTARGQLIGFCWKARRDEPGREGAHTQHNAHSWGL
jgi:hypothetical protein